MTRIAVLLKQVPDFDDLSLGPDHRLDRSTSKAKISSYCQRAIAMGVELAGTLGAELCLVTMGAPPARDALREAYAWGRARGVDAQAVLVSDPAFSGSDTLATARALVAALTRCGPFDLLLCGNASLDSDTGQVPAQVAELLGWGLLAGARHLSVTPVTPATGAVAVRPPPVTGALAVRPPPVTGALAVRATLEHDVHMVEAEANSPVVVTCAERLCAPCKVDRQEWAELDLGSRLTVIAAADLGPGPWGQEASPTRVTGFRTMPRRPSLGMVLSGADPAELAAKAVEALAGVGVGIRPPGSAPAAAPSPITSPIAVVGEPGDPQCTAELLCHVALFGAPVVLFTEHIHSPGSPLTEMAASGAGVPGAPSPEIVAFDAPTPRALVGPLAEWCGKRAPAMVVAPFTFWGREVAGRLAARLGMGLAGGVTGMSADNGSVIAFKPGFGGDVLATVSFASPIAIATVIPGSNPTVPVALHPPSGAPPTVPVALHPPSDSSVAPAVLACPPDPSVTFLSRRPSDDPDALRGATTLICVGAGVDPSRYPDVEELARALAPAAIVATRKVTDQGWLPRSRQVGITGRHVAPELYIAIGVSGRPSHLAGIRHAGAVLSVNPDPQAPMVRRADVSILAPFEDVLPALLDAFVQQRGPRAASPVAPPFPRI